MILKLRCVWLLGLTLANVALIVQSSQAEIVISTFEDAHVGADSLPDLIDSNLTFRGYMAADESPIVSEIRSGKVSFTNDGAGIDQQYGFPYWNGIGLSQRTAPAAGQQFYEHGNDLISQPGVGASGSQTWGVVYGQGELAADPGYRFQGLSLTNTYWTWSSVMGQAYDQPFVAGDYFTVSFTNADTLESVNYDLADFRNGNSLILSDWREVNLESLNASRLSVSFLGSRDFPPLGLETPSYVAIDNVAVASISAVPEPSSIALLSLGGGILFWHRRRRQAAPRASA